jgi:adenylosuccinate lyase
MLNPLDERYYSEVCELDEIFRQETLYKLMFEVEVEYLIHFLQFKTGQDKEAFESLKQKLKWQSDYYNSILLIEQNTRHDVYSIVAFISNLLRDSKIDNSFSSSGIPKISTLVHFGLTSADVKGIAEIIQFTKSMSELNSNLLKLINNLYYIKSKFGDICVPSYTHGQVATPLKFSEMISVYIENFSHFYDVLTTTNFHVKFGGANGTFNSLKPFFKKDELFKFRNVFINNTIPVLFKKNYGWYPKFTLENKTTQISSYIQVCNHLSSMKILMLKTLSFCQDMWLYNSNGLISLESLPKEIGSSTMPHKVNPIDFENAEGACKVAISLIDVSITSLSASRMHRDLSGSLVNRNMGTTMGYALLAVKRAARGCMLINTVDEYILDSNPKVLMEYYQTAFKFVGDEEAYEKCKAFSRGKKEFSIISFLSTFQTEISNISSKGFKILTHPKEYTDLHED